MGFMVFSRLSSGRTPDADTAAPFLTSLQVMRHGARWSA
jgi:hypothetical protein